MTNPGRAAGAFPGDESRVKGTAMTAAHDKGWTGAGTPPAEAERPPERRMTMLFAPEPSHEYLPHTGELVLRLRGSTISEVLRQAALALSDVLLSGRPAAGSERVCKVRLDAPDRATLLIDWLNELLYLAEHHRWVPTQVDLEATETHLDAVARGPELPEAPSLVKAATWHNLSFEVRDGGFEAQVLLDV